MNINTRNYKVVINGEEYNLVSDEGEAKVLHAVRLVDELISQLSSQQGHIDKRKIAILVALQFASKYLQNESLLVQQKQQEDALTNRIEQLLSSL
jgi:cell division protein ZapA (FtsZ GTPase activity inhibitor)